MSYNRNLVTLKCVLFLFFGALGSLIPFLPLHMTAKGLSIDQAKIVSIVAPCIALIGPLVAGPLADKLAGGLGKNPRYQSGKYLRIMLATCFIFSILLYWLLMIVPPIIRKPGSPSVTLWCNAQGGEIRQEKYSLNDGPEDMCTDFDSDTISSLYVTECVDICEENQLNELTTAYPEQDLAPSAEYDDQYDEGTGGSDGEDGADKEDATKKPLINRPKLSKPVPHPHMCYNIKKNGEDLSVCEVYTPVSKPIKLELSLHPSIKSNNDTNDVNVCRYPIGSDFRCRLGPKMAKDSTSTHTSSCDSAIKCKVYNPYNDTKDTLVDETTENAYSFWFYILIRSIADIFPAAAIALLGGAVIIATRETSTGRGDVGKQFAVGALGFGLFPLLVGCFEDMFMFAIGCFTFLLLLATVVILIDDNMPLTPPEWWWHTRCGFLALPLSSIRKYNLEIGSLALVLLLLGILWNGIDTFLPWRILALNGNMFNVALTVSVGALPAVIFLIYIEKIADYCGHNNILIAAFVFYIIQYTGLTFIDCPYQLLILEALEVFTLHIMWVTAVLYLRHLIPRKFMVSGQALPVITHFCLGRAIGGAFGATAYPSTINYLKVQENFALAALVMAVIYFLLYHFYLKPKCAAPVVDAPRPSPALIQSMNGNGSYTPLRVYHNGKAKKGQFRY